MKKKLQLMILLLLCFGICPAQQATDASGGNATGTNGNVSYSYGQVFNESTSGSGGSVSQGVQQPFEIATLGTENFAGITLQAIIYPNPTAADITLKMENYSLKNITVILYDAQGRLLLKQNITQTETKIMMGKFPSSTYILQVLDNQKAIKSFKIIKN
ncbi:T9SS type A sorting domain-containing protein [Kaistella sp. G5-32]|uniref:T9SS type A sorting domain-containing protein n=1 Tax=Kaistella gelatinilytica TaxID=2787636 RepID=A0ABS0F823_9FLAO|nr:T9SS type A sorting domain-containing protein [Kaistella gelatinilytica]MBF8455855.1 T9SS type A sorting domain-containing protein [Kaistella gelatinilytica]